MLEVHKCAFSDFPGLCKVGSCEIVVKGGSSVVNIPPRQIPIHIQSSVEREINKLLKAEIIEPANEEWSSPTVPIRKKDGSIRLCVDYRELRVPAHRLRNFLLMVAMHDYYYCILTGASPLQHKDKVPAEGAAH